MSQRREPYTKLYASWWCHPRTGPLSLAAGGLEARMLSWSAHHGADGRVPKASLVQLAGGASKKEIDRAVNELRTAGVIVDDGDAYVIRDYLDANISKQRDEERRRGQNERQSRHRQGAVTRDVTPSVTRDMSVTEAPSLDHDHDHDHDQSPPSGGDSRAPAPAVPMLAERAVLDAFEARCERVRVAVDRECRAVRRSPPPPACTLQSPEVTTVARWLSTAGEVDVDEMVRRWANARDRKSSWAPLSWLAANPGEYAFPAPSGSVVRLTSEQEDQSVRDFIDAGTRRAGGVA